MSDNLNLPAVKIYMLSHDMATPRELLVSDSFEYLENQLRIQNEDPRANMGDLFDTPTYIVVHEMDGHLTYIDITNCSMISIKQVVYTVDLEDPFGENTGEEGESGGLPSPLTPKEPDSSPGEAKTPKKLVVNSPEPLRSMV